MCARKILIEIPSKPNLQWEEKFLQEGKQFIAGLDEAGRGAWAGPVYAAAVILPATQDCLKALDGVRDSKQMTASQREHWSCQIKNTALAWAIGSCNQGEIDSYGILYATRTAMLTALTHLKFSPDHLLVDALLLPSHPASQTSLIKGDQRSISIAAASILAKTARDAYMKEIDPLYPQYGFGTHKGYGTRRHATALHDFGPCPLHRMTFKPLIQPTIWGS